MTRECGCSRPCREGFTLCDTCRDDLEQHLAEMRWVDEQLDISLTRAHGIDYAAMGGARSTETPLPWNDRASRVRAELRAELVSWVRILSQGGDWPADRLPDLAAWLLKRLPVITKHDDAWTIHQGITDASQKARAIVFAKPADILKLGPCEGAINDEGEVTEVDCDGEIRATEGDSVAECYLCKRAYDVYERQLHIDDLAYGLIVPADELAARVRERFGTPVTKVLNLINTWRKRGRIVAVGYTITDRGDMAHTYRFRDVMPLLSDVYDTRPDDVRQARK